MKGALRLLRRLLAGALGDQLGQAVVGQGRDGREVPVGDPLGALELADVVGHLAEREIDDGAAPGPDIGRAGVHQVAVEHQDRGGRAGGAHAGGYYV